MNNFEFVGHGIKGAEDAGSCVIFQLPVHFSNLELEIAVNHLVFFQQNTFQIQ